MAMIPTPVPPVPVGRLIKEEASRAIGKALGAGAVAGGAYFGYSLLSNLLERLRSRKRFETAYRRMHQFFPELQAVPEPAKREIAGTIHTLSPVVGEHPILLGSVVSRIHSAQYFTPDVAKLLLETREEHPVSLLHRLRGIFG